MRTGKSKKAAPKAVGTRGADLKKRRRRAPKKTSTIDALATRLSPEEAAAECSRAELFGTSKGLPSRISRVKDGTAIAATIAELVHEKAARIKGRPAEKILKLLLSI